MNYSELILKQKYMRKNREGEVVESLEEFYTRIARGLSEAEESPEKREQLARDIYDVLSQGRALFGGRTLVAAGIVPEEGQKVNLTLLNCFVLGIEDSLSGIYRAVYDASKVLSAGGGVGYNFSTLRPEGTPASNFDRVASGPVSFMEVFHASAKQINQGSRRGAQMGILECWHPDIFKFLEIKHRDENTLTTFNLSVGVYDKLMQAALDNKDWTLEFPGIPSSRRTVPAKELVRQIAEYGWRNGEPGVIYLDTVNRFNPTPHLGPLKAVNPCVAKGTLVATDRGLKPIEMVTTADKVLVDFRLAGGQSVLAPLTKRWKVGVKPTCEVRTVLGYSLRATPDHKVYTNTGWVAIQDLTPNHLVYLQSKGVFGEGVLCAHAPWEAGFLLGAATQCMRFEGNRAVLYINREPAPHLLDKLSEYFVKVFGVAAGTSSVRTNRGRYYTLSTDHPEVVSFFRDLVNPRHVCPEIWECDILTQAAYAAGLLWNRQDALGPFAVVSRYTQLAKEFQLLLLNLGVPAELRISPISQPYFFPADNVVLNRRALIVAPTYESRDLCAQLFQIEPDPIIIKALQEKPPENFMDRVVNVTPCEDTEVYDLTEPDSHSYVAGGFVVHNCSEATLYPDEACCLGSINLKAHLVDDQLDTAKLAQTARIMTRALDNVLTVSYYPLQDEGSNRIRDAVWRTRKLGLGIMGLHDALIALEIPYDSEEGRALASSWMEVIHEAAKETSIKLAEEKGAFPAFEPNDIIGETPRRNATLTSIAPTGSISMVLDVSNGCEPYYDVVMSKFIFDREEVAWTIIRPLQELAEKHHYWGQERAWRELLEQPPSDNPEEVQAWRSRLFDILGDRIAAVVKGAKDIDPRDHIRMLATLTKYTDQSISKTVNCSFETSVDQVEELLYEAWESGCKSFTVYRDGSRQEAILSSGVAKNRPKVRLVEDLTTVPRPKGIPSWSSHIATPAGTLNGTITIHPEFNREFEMFLQVGKGGSDAAAFTEALGRLISMLLKKGATLQEIEQQLRDIGGSQPIGFGNDRVLSLPDGVARLIGEYLESKGKNVKVEEVKTGELCPRCGNNSILRSGQCLTCTNPRCSYTTCT